MNIIKTIGDDDEVENFSEDSDVELEFQPTNKKNKRTCDFDEQFTFVGNVEEYNKDPWNDLNKYIKRKAKTKTDDKIKKARLENDHVEDVQEEVKSECDDLSEDELKHDRLRNREKKVKRSKKQEEDFFEEGNIEGEYTNFYQMNLSRPLMKAISRMKFVHPTPIQAATIPVALLGKDICGCAATGTGKTAAYMLPTLERLLYRPPTNAITRVLVLVPTRELGVQVYQVSRQIAQYTDIQMGLAVGGLDIKTQEGILRKNPDIVIATPGRLIDHLKSTPTFSLDSIEILILDEADRMLDEYFAEQMKEIIKQCSRTRQTMLFSATMTDEVESLAAVSLNKPVRLFVDSNTEVAFNLRQEFVRIRTDKEADREAILAALVCRTFRDHCIIFVQTKKQAHRIHILLGLLGVKIAELHGNLTQPQRLDSLNRFKDKLVDVLVATDVAARGLDIPGIQTVVNFVMPATLEHYIHRVGRTARAGRAGVSVSLAGEKERKIVKDVIKRAKNPVKSRVIPPDILSKYKDKVEKLEPQIKQILREEYEERLLSKAENQANRADKLVKGEDISKRPWFQTAKQRKEEKDRLSLDKPEKNIKINKKDNLKKDNKNDLKKKKLESADDRINDELNKVMLLQAKFAKKKNKPQKIRCIEEKSEKKRAPRKKFKSQFSDLTDTSDTNAKKLRYEANKFNKNKTLKKKVSFKANQKVKTKNGKLFGKPAKKNSRF